MKRPIATVLTAFAVLAASGCSFAGSSEPPPGPTADLSVRGPVLLIPGYGGGTQPLQAMSSTLRAQGVVHEIINIDDGTGDLTLYAQRVIARAQQLVAGGSPSVDLIGFSAGGVIARIAGTDTVGRPLIRRIATVGTPHEGTQVAAIGALFGQCPPACQQLDPDSELLKELPPASSSDRYLTVWSRSDDVVRPPESSALKNANEVIVQDVCNRVVGHDAVMRDPVTLTSIPAFLADSALPSTCPG
jgi:pimeloyl-ACP methyl ester carboxylesterase